MQPSARLATASDAARVAELLDAFNREYDEPTPGTSYLSRRLAALLESPTAYGVVAGEPVSAFGLVTLRPSWWSDGLAAVLDELYTVPAERGTGLGGAVLELAVAEAGRRGVVDFAIEVDEPDHDAHRFYARHGFPLRDPSSGECAFVIRRDL